jgi:VanZ family protein
VDRLFRCLTWACVVALAFLSLTPGDVMMRTGAPGLAEHFVAYLGTGATAALGYARRASYLRIAALLMAYAGLLEVLQLLVPARHSDLVDFAAGAAGVVAGAVLVRFWRTISGR